MSHQWSIEVENLGKQYSNGVWGMRNFSFKLESGSLVALIGANGAGKTTFIHLLAGLLKPTEGKVTINTSRSIKKGWCSQHQAIDWFLSVENNVRLGARLSGLDHKVSHSRSLEALRTVGLDHMVKKQPDQLSGGQQQRLQIARSLVSNPDFLLLDEPTTGLDPAASMELMKMLKQKTRDGALAVVSSHDLSLIETQADYILFLKDGQLLTFESINDFAKRFHGCNVVEIEYQGQLSNATKEKLHKISMTVIGTSPLELLLKEDLTLSKVVDLIDGEVQIVNCRRRLPGLREAYFALTKTLAGKESNV